jgi:hypothetical protein
MSTKKRVNKPTDKRFPRALEALACVLDKRGVNAPLDVQRIASASRDAMVSIDPRTSINKRFIGLRTAHPVMFTNVLYWLCMGNTDSLFTNCGAHWALSELKQAFTLMSKGETPHVALGMNLGGKPNSWNFTVAEDAALYAQDLHQNEGYSIDNAKIVAATDFRMDKANINKAKLPKNISDSDVATQARIIKKKYKL